MFKHFKFGVVKIKKDMANKRDPNKAYIGVFIDKNAKELVMKILNEQGSNLTEFFYAKILELLESREDEIIKKLKESDGRRTNGRTKRNKKS